MRRYVIPAVAAALIASLGASLGQIAGVPSIGFFTEIGTVNLPIQNSATGVTYNGVVAVNGPPSAAVTPTSTVITGGIGVAAFPTGAAARLHGGPATTTGTGGDATVRGGVGGTTSGAGGLASITGGAATAGNSTGGLARAVGGAGSGSSAGGAALLTGGLGGATGAGGAASVVGGAGGATSGSGGQALVTGGAGTAGNANGGSTIISGGAANGSGIAGMIIERGTRLLSQPAQSTQDTAATLTTAQLQAGILTSNPAGAVNLQLPLASAMDTAFPDAITNDSFDFSVISLSGTNLPTLTTNTGWTLVGTMTFTSVAGNAGRFRARKTGTATWTLYRIS
jgi:hypothetical protein